MKRILMIVTGGTIACEPSSDGLVPRLSGKDMLNGIPGIASLCEIESLELMNLDSSNLQPEDWQKMARAVADNYEGYDGFVITHGTDTMEETAYFVHLAAKTNKPIIFVGSMRPSTGMSADGPKNLYNAVVLAASEKAAGKGVLVAMNEQIISAREAFKSNTTSVETFQPANFGTLGYIFNSEVHFGAVPAQKHTVDTPFDVTGMTELPKVGIVYNYSNVPAEPVKALVAAGYEGLVNAGLGNGNIHKNVLPVLAQAAKDGIAVVRASRVVTGSTTKHAEVDDSKYGFIAAQFLNPQKARVLLQLALTVTKDPAQIQAFFDEY